MVKISKQSSIIHSPKRLNALRSINIMDTSADKRFDTITKLAKSIFKTQLAGITFIDEQRTWTKSYQGAERISIDNSASLCVLAIESDESIYIVSDILKNPSLSTNPLTQAPYNIRFYAGVPFSDMNGNKLGTLCILDHSSRILTADEIEQLNNLSYLVGEILRSIQTAIYDDLTLILNRRGFFDLGNREIELAKRGKQSVALILIDLNKFKPINDTYGHHVGDLYLKAFAKMLTDSARGSDLIFRLGGDEFAIMLINSDPQTFLSRLNQLTDRPLFVEGHSFKISYSYGVVDTAQPSSECDLANADLHSLLASADKKMYQHKRAN